MTQKRVQFSYGNVRLGVASKTSGESPEAVQAVGSTIRKVFAVGEATWQLMCSSRL